MKAILISIKPEWVAKILNGEKTIEVRKTAPKCELPITVYIYCTKSNKHLLDYEFEKDGCNFFLWDMKSHHYPFKGESDHYFNGKVVAKFTLFRIERFGMAYPYEEPTSRFLEKACVTIGEARKYAGGKHPYYNPLYAWHIEDLVIFDEPMELDEFDYPNPSGTRYVGKRSLNGLPSKKHPPQSWCYVEELE